LVMIPVYYSIYIQTNDVPPVSVEGLNDVSIFIRSHDGGNKFTSEADCIESGTNPGHYHFDDEIQGNVIDDWEITIGDADIVASDPTPPQDPEEFSMTITVVDN